MTATGPDFISRQTRDLDASQAFYEQFLGLVRSAAGPPHAVVFETTPIAFALRDTRPDTDLAAVDGPFGRTFTFADPDGYHVTLHDRA